MLQAVLRMFSCYLHVICISFPQLSQAQVMGVKSQFIKGKPTWFSTGIFFFFTFYQNHAKWWFNSLVVLHFFVRLQMSRPAEIHFLEMWQRSFWVSVSGVCSPNTRQEGRKTYHNSTCSSAPCCFIGRRDKQLVNRRCSCNKRSSLIEGSSGAAQVQILWRVCWMLLFSVLP